jgi:pilus assembly protein CpaE
MQAFIVSDHEPTSAAVRQVLHSQGHDCPAGNVLPLGRAADGLAQAHSDLVIVALSPEPEQGLAVLSGLRLRSPARLLAVGPASDTRLVLRAMRAGVSDYLDEAALEGELRTALGRLQTNLPDQAEPGRIIALLAPSGGSGSSTLAANVAAVLAKEHKRSLLIDLKLQTGDLASLLDLKPTYTIAELCQNAAQMDRIMFERSLVRHASGAHLLAPPRAFADVAHVTAGGVRQALNLGRGLFPYVVVDLDHTFGEEQVEVLRQADVVLLVLRLDFSSLRHAQRALDYLTRLGLADDRVRLVVNRHGQPKEVPAAKAEQALGRKIFHLVPEDARSVNRANNNGVPVVLDAPSAKVSRSVAKLAASVNGRHHRP